MNGILPLMRRLSPAVNRRPLRWAALALLAGYLLCHIGCHGDEDNELFALVRHVMQL